MKIKVMSVFGTRPEAVKMLPLVKVIQNTPQMESIVCVTAQHRDMLDHVLAAFGAKADYDLNIMAAGQTLQDITTRVLQGVTDVLAKARPDIVLVHGDTTTSFVAGLAAFYSQVTVGHVEAGLRTYDRYSPFPEEMNRTLLGRLSTLHFAPTETTAGNLRREGIDSNIFITGNTVIDAMRYTVQSNYTFKSDDLRVIRYDGMRTALMTLHRRENLGEPLRQMLLGVRDLLNQFDDLQIIYPMHKNPLVRQPALEILGSHPRARLIEPIGVFDLHNLYAKCYMVMTDSGGLQEEAPTLGKPVLVFRDTTERVEAVEAGTVRLAGVTREGVVREASRLLSDESAYRLMAEARNPYGDGHASERITQAILDYFKDKKETAITIG